MYFSCASHYKLTAIQVQCRMRCRKADNMARFKLPTPPSSTNKTIRFPNDVIEGVEQAIRGTDCNFSAFVIAATRMALEDLQEQANDEDT